MFIKFWKTHTVCRYSAQSIETIGIFWGLPININDTYCCWQNIKANIKLIKLPSVILACTCITQQKSCLSSQSIVQNWSRMNRLYVNRFSLSTILALPRQPIRTIGGHALSSTFSGEPWEYMYSVIQASPVCRNKISIRSSVFWTLVFSIDVFVQF